MLSEKNSRHATKVCNEENLQNPLYTNPSSGIRGSDFGLEPHGQLAGFTHPPGSWLGPAVDYVEPGFQTSSEGLERLRRAQALES